MSVETCENELYPSTPALPTPWQCQQESTSGTMGAMYPELTPSMYMYSGVAMCDTEERWTLATQRSLGQVEQAPFPDPCSAPVA